MALATTLLAGVLTQGLIGGLTVLSGLQWWTAAVHLLVSTVPVWLSVLLLA